MWIGVAVRIVAKKDVDRDLADAGGEHRPFRVSLLVRDLRSDGDFRDQTVYRLGNRSYGPYRDNFRRIVVSEMIEVKNHALP